MNDDILFSMPVAALAFDVDGTIADTDPVHARAWLGAVRTVTGRSGFDVKEYINECVLGAMSPKLFMARYVTAEEWLLVEKEKRRTYPSLLTADVSLAEGLHELVLSAQDAGVRIAIVSSSSQASVEAILDHAWRAAPPDVIICRKEGVSSKPDPSPYYKALELLDLAPAQVVAFEDADAGVRSAKAAGLTCVQIGPKASKSADTQIFDFRACHITRRGGRVCLIV